MRVRTLVAAAATLLLTALPAHAGTGAANSCAGGTTVPGPLTLTVRITGAPTDAQRWIRVCFSDTPAGQPSRITGGAVEFLVWTDTGTYMPGYYLGITCTPDVAAGGVFPTCAEHSAANVVLGDTNEGVVVAGTCIVLVGSTCSAWAPGVWVNTDRDKTRPLVHVDVLGFGTDVVSPQQCIQVLTTAPCS